MVATVQQIIGKINPGLYADKEEWQKSLKRHGSADKIPAEEVKAKPLTQHHLGYESSTETLEPIYFFILDLMSDLGLDVEKFVDNFSSSPGSGHFSELGQRATIMQQQGGKVLGDINTVLRSILNLVYDLKEFRIRLKSYEDFRSKDKSKSDSARLSLKQIWMDKVDMAKGNSSIKAMAFQGGFQTLIDAFLFVKDESLKDDKGNEIDLNERVKRILKPRIQEFNYWLDQSEIELTKRYELEKNYLRSQVNSLKLYSRWAKPYLRAAQQLEMKDQGKEPAMVKAFNTIILELSLVGKSKLNIGQKIESGDLPDDFKKMKMRRDYFSCVIVDFKFRGIPQKVAQQSHYAFGGKVDVNFLSYALNKDELKRLNKEFEDSDLGDALKLIEGATTESLSQIQKEIDFFLDDKVNERKKKEKTGSGANPFLALIGHYNKEPESKEEKTSEKEEKTFSGDDWIEKNHLRPVAEKGAEDTAFNLFDIYKKAHGMISYT